MAEKRNFEKSDLSEIWCGDCIEKHFLLWLTWCCWSFCPSAHRSGEVKGDTCTYWISAEEWPLPGQGHAHSIRPTCSTFGSQSSRKILSGNLVWIAFPKGSYVHGVLINLVFNLVPNQAPAWWISPASSPRSSWPRWSGPSPCSWSLGWGWRT